MIGTIIIPDDEGEGSCRFVHKAQVYLSTIQIKRQTE
jgi:hypothetical protein